MTIVDAHTHLWKKQQGRVNGLPVYATENGRSMFGTELRQMMPPYMLSGSNTAEMLLSNMEYSGVSGVVITQEEIDGNQDGYLLEMKKQHPDRLKICSLYEENLPYTLDGFDGVKLCASRFKERDLTKHFQIFQEADCQHKFVSIDLSEGDTQVASLREIIQTLPELRIAIGHFGMVTKAGWEAQVKLARYAQVFIESGGITWLFNSEFYPFPSAVEAINQAGGLCGFDKLMWGSDYPRTMTEITYKMSFDFILKTNKITEENKKKFLGVNAVDFYSFLNIKDPKKIKNMLED